MSSRPSPCSARNSLQSLVMILQFTFLQIQIVAVQNIFERVQRRFANIEARLFTKFKRPSSLTQPFFPSLLFEYFLAFLKIIYEAPSPQVVAWPRQSFPLSCTHRQVHLEVFVVMVLLLTVQLTVALLKAVSRVRVKQLVKLQRKERKT